MFKSPKHWLSSMLICTCFFVQEAINVCSSCPAGGTSSDAILFLLLWGAWAVWRWAQRVRGGWAARAAQREAAAAHSLSGATFMQAAGDSPKSVGIVV